MSNQPPFSLHIFVADGDPDGSRLDRHTSLRSRRKRRAWGVSPRKRIIKYSEPADAGDSGWIFEPLNAIGHDALPPAYAG